MMEGLRKPKELIVVVVTLLAYGCPVQAIVHALELDERTVARWQERAGAHCQNIHQDQVMQAQLDLQHVQVDEIRAKGRQMVPWMAMALMVSTRLWLGGVVSLRRDRDLANRILRLVKACCQPRKRLLVLTDGWAAYPNSIRRTFRDKLPREGTRGRCALQVWPELVIGTVIKKTAKKRVVEIIRRMAQGTLTQAQEMLAQTRGGNELNTAFIERFNGTLRERLASLTRRCRHAVRRVERLEAGMWLVGCTYNFCWPHHELSRRWARTQEHKGEASITPAMAAGLTDHVWSVQEVLTFRIAPSPWTEPTRRWPKKAKRPSCSPSSARLRPLLRLRKGVLCSSTS